MVISSHICRFICHKIVFSSGGCHLEMLVQLHLNCTANIVAFSKQNMQILFTNWMWRDLIVPGSYYTIYVGACNTPPLWSYKTQKFSSGNIVISLQTAKCVMCLGSWQNYRMNCTSVGIALWNLMTVGHAETMEIWGIHCYCTGWLAVGKCAHFYIHSSCFRTSV